jgi:serine protease Do
MLLAVPLADHIGASEHRFSPIVRAVQQARPAVVNIQGQKTVTGTAAVLGTAEGPREVNGMGTGVVIDPRGYILTNHHVVAGVRRINVTFDGGQETVALLVAHDEETDLAIIKVRTGEMLPIVAIGTSADLMTGEEVIALGNAYGYEHTVTRGIISALHRDVQVTDTQSYDDLIQTDASINPGNSGGPLLNVDGQMIGVNVAVRAGAQGIGFAIPVDKAMEVAASLMSIQRLESRWHGVVSRAPSRVGEPVVVEVVQSGSPAERSGLERGDEIVSVASIPIARPLDVERALLGRRHNESLPVEVRRHGERLVLDLVLADRAVSPASATSASATVAAAPARSPQSRNSRTWDVLGMELVEEPQSTFAEFDARYRGGMRVVTVRSDGPAAQQGIRAGDILVGMHRWETASTQDVDYIVRRAANGGLGSVKFYVVRGTETLFGQIELDSSVARRPTSLR